MKTQEIGMTHPAFGANRVIITPEVKKIFPKAAEKIDELMKGPKSSKFLRDGGGGKNTIEFQLESRFKGLGYLPISFDPISPEIFSPIYTPVKKLKISVGPTPQTIGQKIMTFLEMTPFSNVVAKNSSKGNIVNALKEAFTKLDKQA